MSSSAAGFNLDPSKIYLKVTDMADNGNFFGRVTKLIVSATNSAGATVPHASVLAYGREYSFGEDGLCVTRRPELDPMKMKQLVTYRNSRLEQDFEKYYSMLKAEQIFTKQAYDLQSNNCIHFATNRSSESTLRCTTTC